jgi:hypothetical protein
MPDKTNTELTRRHFREDLINESKRIIDSAKEKDIILRVLCISLCPYLIRV